ncbi:methionine ABC transporter ATP-binding protein, partial [Burkholderia sp. Ac-20392]|nr:methionine ABC transporter ATP-binding protein [Burkholderia sp. Ac-20392]
MTQLFDTLGFIDTSAARAGAAATTHDAATTSTEPAGAGGAAVSL